MTPTYIYADNRDIKPGTASQRDLGTGHTIIDLDRNGWILGVEFIPTPPLPLVHPVELIEGQSYWLRPVQRGSTFRWQASALRHGSLMWADYPVAPSDLEYYEIRGPIPRPLE